MFTNEQAALLAATNFVSNQMLNPRVRSTQNHVTIVNNVSFYQKQFLAILNDTGATPPAVLHEESSSAPPDPHHIKAKDDAIRWARGMMADGCLFLDFETNGWGDGFPSEIVQISIVNHRGEILVDRLVKPDGPILDQAVRIHGITEEMVKDAPDFKNVWEYMMKPNLGTERHIVIYNVDFEKGKLYTALKTHNIRLPNYAWQDAMIQYAAFHGDWKEEKQDWKWKKLVEACEALGVEVEEKPHSAIGDALRTLGIVKAMALTSLSDEIELPIMTVDISSMGIDDTASSS